MTMTKFTSDYLAGFGFEVATLIDIGVYRGTIALYNAFPDARLVLIDPLEEVEAVYAKVKHRFDTIFLQIAVGEKAGTAEFLVPPGPNLSGASFYDRVVNKRRGHEMRRRQVDVRPLDDVVAAHGFAGPFGVKIDTEGHESAVIAGGKETLRQASFVLLELTLQNIYEVRTLPSAIVAQLAGIGFELLDVLDVDQRNPVYLNCIFVKADDPRFAARYVNSAASA